MSEKFGSDREESEDEDVPLLMLAKIGGDDNENIQGKKRKRIKARGTSKSPASCRVPKRTRGHPIREDGRETLWDIVSKNVRPIKKTDGSSETSELQRIPNGDALDSLLDEVSCSTRTSSEDPLAKLLDNPSNSLQKFGGIASGSAPVLSLDDDGGLLMAEPASGQTRDLHSATDLVDFLDGKSCEVVTLAYDTQIQPFEGAYKKTKSLRWSKENTDRLYEALEVFGSDLMMVGTLLPELTDKQIHDKFKIEGKRNPARVAASLEKQPDSSNARRMIEVFESVKGRSIDSSTGQGVGQAGQQSFGDDLLDSLAGIGEIETSEKGDTSESRDEVLSMFN